MEVFDTEHHLRARILGLALPRAIAFAAACCQRLIPVYKAFSLLEDWGDSGVIERGYSLVWDYVGGSDITAPEFDSASKQVSAITPNSDEFNGILSYPAAMCGWAVCSTLDACCAQDISMTPNASAAGLDALYYYVRAANEPDLGEGTTNEFEHLMWSSPMMLAEMARQLDDLAAVTAAAGIDHQLLERLRGQSSAGGIDPYLRGLVPDVMIHGRNDPE